VQPQVTVRFWAGARRAAGHAEEQLRATTLGEVKGLLAARPALTLVCAASSYLVDGQRAGDETAVLDGSVVDVLPPFAGG
jgi:molybdopterin converting factor small subunit